VTVSVGQPVPDFSTETTAGPFRLATSPAQVLVVYFYPKDNTPGCTTQGAAFRDAWPRLQAAGASVLGVSRDSLKSHAGFKAKMAFPFELAADPDETLCAAFDVMKMKNMYGKQVRGIERSTFVIGPDRRLLREWRGVKVPGHVDEVVSFVESL
jgi:peroxiredoxin Q/BCP